MLRKGQAVGAYRRKGAIFPRQEDEAAVAATKAACLASAEEGAARCRRVGTYPAQQITLNMAARIRMRHIE